MTSGLPSGFVDPADAVAVAEVLRGTAAQLGLTGLVELLTQVPGLRIEPGRPAGRLRRGEPAQVLGADYRIVLSTPAVREHLVGGIVLSRQSVPAAELAGLLARVVQEAVAGSGGVSEASVALTSVRDALAAMG